MGVIDLIYIVEDIKDNNGIILFITEDEDDAEQFVIDKQLQQILYNVNKKTFDFIQYLMEFTDDDDLRDYFLNTEVYKIVGREKDGGIK